MASAVLMPRQGNSVESCIIGHWQKKKGDTVQVGDILFTYETDKATFDAEANISGILLDVYYNEGDEVPCMTNVCVIGSFGENTDEFDPFKTTLETEKAIISTIEDKSQAPDQASVSVPPQSISDAHIGISPRAKKLLETSHADYRMAIPTGPYGRIMERDVQQVIASGILFTRTAYRDVLGGSTGIYEGTGLGGRITTGDLSRKEAVSETNPAVESFENHPEYEIVKLSNIRKVIAKAMNNSLSTTAQLTINSSFDATEILTYRKKLKAGKEDFSLENITINDLILFAVSRTILPAFNNLNSNFLGDTVRYFKNVNLGVAIDTERGLMVPTIFGAEKKSLNDISKEVKSLAKACQTGTINPDLLKGASFTVTNLGSFGIESFTPVLNAPQVAILGVNNVTQRARKTDDGYEFYPAMGMSLTFDHQAVDGAPAAKFLQALCKNLENFNILLAI